MSNPARRSTSAASSYATRSAQAHSALSQQQQPAPRQQYGAANAAAASAGIAVATGNFGPPQPQAPTASRASNHGHPGPGSSGRKSSSAETPAQQAEQARLLTDSTRRVQEHAYYMKVAIEADDLPTALDRASNLLGELGDPSRGPGSQQLQGGSGGGGGGPRAPAPTLNPKNYYELHMRCLDEMPILEDYLAGLVVPGLIAPGRPRRHTARALYAAAQYAERAVPRLYLQVLAGSVLIRSGEVPSCTVLEDLLEAVKCIQCPIRGLFLRHFLLGQVRDKLPMGNATVEEVRALVFDSAEAVPPADAADDAGAKSGGEHKGGDGDGREVATDLATPVSKSEGTVADSIFFLLTNFTEMNKLWVRIQYMSSSAGGGTYHHPGDRQAARAMRRRREKERNELRLLVGTNLVRLSQLDGGGEDGAPGGALTPDLYRAVVLPAILEQITACRDPLAQAYLMDCVIQVFPDEFHLATLDTFLGICPKLREKVNIRTIVGSIMERLGNYFDDARLVEEEGDEGGGAGDGNVMGEKKGAVAKAPALLATDFDAFSKFDNCVQTIYKARGSSMPPKEVIRLQTALLNFSLRVHPGNMTHISTCLGVCARYLSGGDAAAGVAAYSRGSKEATAVKFATAPRELDDVAVDELEKLLSIPLDSLALRVLELESYADLVAFLPWDNRRQVAAVLLNAVLTNGNELTDLTQIEELFCIITPLVRDDPGGDGMARDGSMAGGGSEGTGAGIGEAALVAKLVHLLRNDDTDMAYEMLTLARRHLAEGGEGYIAHTLGPVAYCAFKLLDEVRRKEYVPKPPKDILPPVTVVGAKNAGDDLSDGLSDVTDDHTEGRGASSAPFPAAFESSVGCRKLFVFLQETTVALSRSDPELGFTLYLQIACAADRCARAASNSRKSEDGPEYTSIAYEIMAQAFLLYEAEVSDSKAQQRAIVSMVGTLLSCRTFEKEDFEALVTKTAQYAAKLLKKTDQCKTVMICSHLFFTGEKNDPKAYRNPQRVLECLQRSLKIADACCMASPSNVQLFVDILDQYLYFYERECPVIVDKFVSGLVALINEHMDNIGAADTTSVAVTEARKHFEQTVLYIKQKRNSSDTAERFATIEV